MKDIRELDFIDRIAILVSSVCYILGMSFVAAALLFVLDIPGIVLFMIQDILNDSVKLSIIWLGIATFSIISYILFQLMKISWFHMKRIHYLLKNDIIKVETDGHLYFIPRSSALEAMINYMESERENEEKKTSEKS